MISFCKLIPGRTHDASFKLFSIGKVASSGMKLFAETGQTNTLECEPSNGALDFTASAIFSGRGSTEASIFVDANHTLVSFVTKITPSPDWFIGIDSLKVTIQRQSSIFQNLKFPFLEIALRKWVLDRQHDN